MAAIVPVQAFGVVIFRWRETLISFLTHRLAILCVWLIKWWRILRYAGIRGPFACLLLSGYYYSGNGGYYRCFMAPDPNKDYRHRHSSEISGICLPTVSISRVHNL